MKQLDLGTLRYDRQRGKQLMEQAEAEFGKEKGSGMNSGNASSLSIKIQEKNIIG